MRKQGTGRTRVTFECVEGFAGPDGGQGLLLVKLVVEVRGQHLHLTLLTLVLRVTAIRAAQERKAYSNYSDCPAGRPHPRLLPPRPPQVTLPAPSLPHVALGTRALGEGQVRHRGLFGAEQVPYSGFQTPESEQEHRAKLHPSGQQARYRYCTSRGPGHSC